MKDLPDDMPLNQILLRIKGRADRLSRLAHLTESRDVPEIVIAGEIELLRQATDAWLRRTGARSIWDITEDGGEEDNVIPLGPRPCSRS